MEHFHSLEQLFLEISARDWRAATKLHGKLDAVIVADDIVAEGGVAHVWPNFQGRGYFINNELPKHFVDLEVESRPIFFLDGLRFDGILVAIHSEKVNFRKGPRMYCLPI